MTSVSKNVYINKLDKIVDKYNNVHHRKIKMKPVGVKSGSHVDFDVESNGKDPKFKFSGNTRISHYRYDPYRPEKN